jgi:hypothetical protein
MAQGTPNTAIANDVPKPTQPDMVVIEGVAYYPGGTRAWPRREHLPADADRLENTMVEAVWLDGNTPMALLRSMVNGQTARIVGYPGGSVVYYSPLPTAAKRKTDDGVEYEEYPLPPECFRENNDIKHNKFKK